MEIYKFGGASIRDAERIKNMVSVLETKGIDNKLIVISAMGKMTNAFEEIVHVFMRQPNQTSIAIDKVEQYHLAIAKALFKDPTHAIFLSVKTELDELRRFFKETSSKHYDFIYDQTVSRAELISTKIISTYLTYKGIDNTWIDVRDFIITNNDYRGAQVDWEITEANIQKSIEKGVLYITQGFIARDHEGFSTTLGREGSDYTAGIFAYCLNASSLTIWKDVDGVLNADPRYFQETELLHKISYTEAIELAFYGASVIHPKTIQPLQKKEIPLYVKSFIHPKKEGTKVSRGAKIQPVLPCFIVKKNQLLCAVSSRDFSFIIEQNISEIFKLLHEHKMKVSLMQNSAISFSVCIEDKYQNKEAFIADLNKHFLVELIENTTLYTIRHFDDVSLAKIQESNKVLLKQTTQETVQMVVQ